MKYALILFISLLTLHSWSQTQTVKTHMQMAARIAEKALTQSKSNWGTLSQLQISTIQAYKENFVKEVKSIHPQQVSDETNFTHFGSNTWIETDLKPYGELRVKTPKDFQTKTIKDYLHYLLHEISHHVLSPKLQGDLTQEDEAQAWSLASMFEEFILLQVPHPQLMDISLNTYSTSSAGCRDTLTIQSLDPYSGALNLQLSTSSGNCRYAEPYFTNNFKSSDHKNLDQINYTLRCRQGLKSHLYCNDPDLNKAFYLCPHAVYYYKNMLQQFLNSSPQILITGKNSLLGNMFWCVRQMGRQELESLALVNMQEVYKPGTDKIPLTDQQQKDFQKLLNTNVDLIIYFLKETSGVQTTPLPEDND